GFQVGFLLPLACVTACIWVASRIRHPLNFVFAIALCTACTFSIASGFSSWLLITPLLLMRQRQSTSGRKWWIIWAGAFLFEALAYSYGYEKPANHPSLWWPVTHPGAAGAYVLVFLGSPFAYGMDLSPQTVGLWMGGLLVLILLACAFYIWFKRN